MILQRLRGHNSSRSGVALALTAVLCLGLLSCAGPDGPDAPSIFDQLTGADLSTAKPHLIATSKTEFPHGGAWAPRTQEFHGDDHVGNDIPSPLRGAPSGGGYELNFNNAPLSQVVQVILRDTLKIPYILDPKVQGKVTISASRAVSRDDLLTTLESILQMNRAAMLKEGDHYKIVLAATLRGVSGGTIDYADEHRRSGPGYGVTILPLHFVSASKMLRLLASFVAKPSALRVEANRNILLIRGTAAERSSLSDVASTFDVDWLRGQSAGIYKLSYATPGEMIAELTQVFRSREGEAGSDLVRFQPVERLNAVLVLTKKSSLLSKVAKWIRRLDKADPRSQNIYVYRLEYAKAKDIAGLLNDMFKSEGSSRRLPSAEVGPGETASLTAPDARPPEAGASSRTAGAADAAGRGASIGETADAATATTSATAVNIVADEKNNKLLIRASGRDYERIMHILGRLDKPPVQVLIRATLAEVTLNDNLRYGVQVFLQEQHQGIGNGVIGFSNGNALTIQPSLPGLNFLVGLPSTPKVILEALSGKTSVRLVSSPSVVVVNNETATLQVGDDVPIARRQAVSVTDPAAPIVNDIEFRKTGVILKVTPRINSSGLVTMKVEQEISTVVTSTTTGNAGTLTPTISQRKIESTIAVYSGQMVVLGGLISERVDRFKNRVPILERVPIIGDAIGKTENTGQRTELVVFIQPTVIRDAADAPLIADELRDRLRALAPKPKPRFSRAGRRSSRQ